MKQFFFLGRFRQPIDPDLQAVLNYADANGITKPDNSLLFSMNRLIIDLKANGGYSQNDVFLLFLNNNVNLANFARICWKRLILVDVYNCTFSPSKGFVTYPNNVNAYIDTLFNPVTASGNYTANSAHLGGIVSEVLSGNANFTGLQTTNFRNFIQIGTVLNQRINSTIAFTPTFDFSGSGFKMMNRTSSSNLIVQNRGTQDTRTQSQNSFISEKQMIGKAGSNFGAMNFGAFTMGGALTSTQITNRRNAYITYLNDIGLSTLATQI